MMTNTKFRSRSTLFFLVLLLFLSSISTRDYPVDPDEDTQSIVSIDHQSSQDESNPSETAVTELDEGLKNIRDIHFPSEDTILTKDEYIDAISDGIAHVMEYDDGRNGDTEKIYETVTKVVYGDARWSVYSRYDVYMWLDDIVYRYMYDDVVRLIDEEDQVRRTKDNSDTDL